MISDTSIDKFARALFSLPTTDRERVLANLDWDTRTRTIEVFTRLKSDRPREK